jgi:pimeloyl-ACP methyl ester carboxylesterase
MYYLLILLFILFIASVLLWKAMLKGFKNPERPHDRTPADLGIEFLEIYFKTENDKNIYGWWINGNKNAPLLILVHGWGRNCGRMLPYIEKLYKEGYNLLAFDSRNHGISDKDEFSSMPKFAEDIEAAINFAERDKTFSNIGLIGLSIGGAASIFAAAKDKRIKSVITVGAFGNPEEVMMKQLKDRHIPYFPFIWLLFIYLQHIIGKKFSEFAPVNFISQAESRFLIIHGTNDQTVNIEQAHKLTKASKQGKTTLWEIRGRGHSDCHEEKDYWLRISDFLSETLNCKAS